MFRHYCLVAYRNLIRNRLYTSINILGLALGLACFIAAYLFADYTRSFEAQFKNSDRIYTLYNSVSVKNREYPIFPYVSVLLTDYIAANFPDVEAIARTQDPFEAVVSVNGQQSYRRVKKVDPDFFKIFDMPIVAGDASDPLGAPGSAVISIAAADALFGTRDVLGRRVLVENKHELTIAAVVDKVSGPSHLGTSFLESSDGSFDLMVRYDWNGLPAVTDFGMNQPGFWFGQAALTHVLLPRDGSLTPAAFTARLQALVDNNLPKDVARITFQTRPVSQYVIWTLDQRVFGGRTSFSITAGLLLLGVLVLVTAGVNFVNLATAQATGRAKDIGMRKVLGATRKRVAAQYFAEVLITVLASLGLALVLVEVALPTTNRHLDTLMALPGLAHWRFWAILGGTVGLVILAAGIYPAIVLARAQPIQALRAASMQAGPRLLRTLLVGAQFAVASLLLIAVLVMHGENQKLRDTGLGLADDPYVEITSDMDDAGIDMEVLADRLRDRPGIRGVTGTRVRPWTMGGGGSNSYGHSADQAARNVLLENRFVSYDYFSTLGMRLLAGRTYSRAFGDDVWAYDEEKKQMTTRPEVSAVIDRAGAEALGWSDPQSAVGQLLYREGFADAPVQAVRVVGVVEPAPLRLIAWGAPTAGAAYFLNPKFAIWPIVRIARADVPTGLASIDTVWSQLSSTYPIQRHFLDEDFDRAMGLFESIDGLFIGLSGFAFVIACMGLLGMAVYMTGRRKREIGIRKSVGATAHQVVWQLVWDFSKPVVIANMLGWPLAFLAATAYLNLFVDRVKLTPVPFLVSFVITVLLAWSAIAAQVLLAARVEPARVLRYE